jgi:thiamine-monophosphate kinase
MSREGKRLLDIGEDALIERITKSWNETIKHGASIDGKPWLFLGVGDDCAILRTQNPRVFQLLKVDALVEGVHFLPDTPPERIGWKAMARVVSDVAAMGGYPVSALITLGTPCTEFVDRIDKIYRGLNRCAREFGISLAGGETTAAPCLFLSVTLTGLVESTRATTRCFAKDGDAIMVTGTLGGSNRGKHLSFMPRLHEARWLVQHYKPNAMMDISDGLAADLPRLERANSLHAHIELESIPRTERCTIEQALCDGEDYELLFTLPQRTVDALKADWPFRLPVTQIGYFSKKPSHKKFENGFDHFLKR